MYARVVDHATTIHSEMDLFGGRVKEYPSLVIYGVCINTTATVDISYLLSPERLRTEDNGSEMTS